MNWTDYIKFQEKTPTNRDYIYDGHGANGGRGVGEWLTPQVVNSKPEYTVVDDTGDTVFVTDQTGEPHVFTKSDWMALQELESDFSIGGAGLLAIAAIGALLLI